jgi:membrane fusion protein (multidrug efflux system)
VYLVDRTDTVRVKDVVASTWTGTEWLIEQGLQPGERVIVDGVQKVGPGIKVRAVPAVDSLATAKPAPGAGGPSQ